MVTSRQRLSIMFLLFNALLSSCNYNHPLNDDNATDNTPPPSVPVEVTVTEYAPMPGQFINTAPPYTEGDDAVTMARKATQYIKKGYVISLGSWGGSITLRLSEPIYHQPSGRDFRILGNAFYNTSSSTFPTRSGASEPGIIMVSSDDNGDGLPDQWYEIAGSEHRNSQSEFKVTYTRSSSGTVMWTSSDGKSGTIEQNKFHSQPYFPQWITDNALKFTGRRLPDNGYLLPTGSFTQRSFEFGYADNQPNSAETSVINLAWAIDNEGNSVELPSINFIKIYTGVFQESSELGECSTEICGIEIPGE